LNKKKYNNMHYLFDIQWFAKHQRKLLWLLNTPIIRIWFRWVMRIKKYDCNEKITEIMPNNFSFGDKIVSIYSDEFKKLHNRKDRKHLIAECKKLGIDYVFSKKTDFRTHNKFSKRLYYAFKPIWYVFHAWDMCINALRLPQLNLGFDTLTVYPDAHPETTSVDGRVSHDYGAGNPQEWSVLIVATGTSFTDDGGENGGGMVAWKTGSVIDRWQFLFRSIFLFDTSSIPDNDTISSATLSIYGNGKVDAQSNAPDINIYSSAPASNTALAGGDYDSFGSTAFSTAITYANWSSSYNVFSFNANGIANISKTGVSKFGARNANYDVSGTKPAWGYGGGTYAETWTEIKAFFAEQTGTSQDPKLVVEYTSTSIKSINGLAKASVKSFNGLAIASVKSINGLA